MKLSSADASSNACLYSCAVKFSGPNAFTDSIFFTEELVHALKVKVAAVSKVHKYTFKADLLAFTMTSYFIYGFMVTS